LRIPIGNKQFETIPLNGHTIQILGSQPSLRVCSFTLTQDSLSLCISKEIPELKEVADAVGVDRNLNNLTVGNQEQVTYYDMSKTTEIARTTRSIMKSLRRNDIRIRRRITGKYGERRKHRVQQLLHKVSKQIVESALKNKQRIVFEDIREIRRLYRKGNWQSKRYRSRMNSWPFHEIKRQIEYKAAWLGVSTVTLTKAETRGTSSRCPRCGERLQESIELKRKLWCQKCREMFDRDLVAAVNIARRGRLRFERSKGVGVEAMVQEPSSIAPVILKVDPTKLIRSSTK
jgi:putative transposase